MSTQPNRITIEAYVPVPPEQAWRAYTTAEAITQWNQASADWHCPWAKIDLRVGGRHIARMEARNGSFGFDYGGTYEVVEEPVSLTLRLDDNRLVHTTFMSHGVGTLVRTTFDTENTHPIELQRQGWQAILDSYADYVTRTYTPENGTYRKPTMQTIDILLDLYKASLNDIVNHIQSIPDSVMTDQPGRQVNHPAWTLSHLAHAAGFIALLLGENVTDMGENDTNRYGPGSVPVTDPSLYASKAELIDRLTRRHEIADRVVRIRYQDYFTKTPPAPFNDFAPTIGHLVVYLLAAHEPYHLGQLRDWKRAIEIH